MQISNKSSFQIILQQDKVDNLSKYWQGQCKRFYDEISMVLPEGSIKPLTLEGVVGRKDFNCKLYNQLEVFMAPFAAEYMTFKFFEAFKEVLKNWSEYQSTANIIITCSDKSITRITQQFVSKLIEYSKENQQLSILHVLNDFKNFTE